MCSTPELNLHPDRLLPSEPGLRTTARNLYDSVKDLPIISPHGHVPAQWLSHDVPFTDSTSLVAQLVVEHRLNEDEAVEVMHDLVVTNPRRAFNQ